MERRESSSNDRSNLHLKTVIYGRRRKIEIKRNAETKEIEIEDEDIGEMGSLLCSEAQKMSKKYKEMASAYKIISNLITLLIAIGGISISVPSFLGTENTTFYAIVGTMISFFKILSAVFDFDSKSTKMKQISTEAKSIFRKASRCKSSLSMSCQGKITEMEKLYTKLDALDLDAFQSTKVKDPEENV